MQTDKMLKSDQTFHIRKAQPSEFEVIGKLLVTVYSGLPGFPKEQDLPDYYKMLRTIGNLTEKSKTELLAALNQNQEVLGAVVYIGDMKHYGSKGKAPQEINAAGIRLLAVTPESRGMGIGKALTLACIEKAKESGLSQVILHTTSLMPTAWKMYIGMGFQRAPELDFEQRDMVVHGFRLNLQLTKT